MSSKTPLFCTQDLGQVIRHHELKLTEAINDIDGDKLLGSSIDDLCDYFENEYMIQVPTLFSAETTVEKQELDVDVSGDWERAISDRTRPHYIKGTSITYNIPFQGDAQIFECRPSTYTSNPPRAEVYGDELQVEYIIKNHDSEKIKSSFSGTLGEIERYLSYSRKDTAAFNSKLRSNVKDRILARREKLLKDQGLVAGLGFPLKERQNAPKTYAVPTSRKKMPAPLPTKKIPYEPEPTLDI